GAGKTTFALTAARRLFEAGRIRRIIVITPTDHLRTQWVAAATGAGFDLRPTPNNEKLPEDADGVVATYAQVAASPRIHEARSFTRPTLVIFDEVHHAGDDLSWGDAVVEAFDQARHRLSITGTPFRSDQARIPNIRYEPNEDGTVVSVADFTYGYRQALRDGVVRPVTFAAYSGASTWRNSAGQVLHGTLGDVSLSKTDEEAAWKTALDPNGEWIPHVFAAMHNRVEELRAGHIPDAAGMVLASNQETARQYADVWQDVTGHRPLLIVSDDPEASDNITRLRDDASVKAAISVRMVSEGVDCPRVSCLAVATTTSTPLFFAQAVGRVVRSRRRGETATVFLPAVRHLLGLAAELETERDHEIEAPAPGEELDMPGDDEEEPPPAAELEEEGGRWEPIESSASFDQLIASRHEDGDRPDEGEAADLFGLPGLLTPDQEAALLRQRDDELRTAARATAARRRARRDEDEAAQAKQKVAEQWGQVRGDTPPPAGQPDKPQDAGSEDVAELRRKIAAAVSAYSTAKSVPHREAWSQLYAKTPGPKNASASLKLLRYRLDVASRM
ncbi:MAG: DEAD/DEAH box helicase family protein, partial [Nocardioides sp.]|nr:DEAD/DEAH box helicase family protein [Nocardioides sp.]